MTHARVHDLEGGRAIVFSTRSPAKETPNEDALGIFPAGPKRCVLAVADGVGGQPNGADAARLAIEHLGRAVRKAEDSPTLREAILDGFEKANAAICDLGTGAATTLVVVELKGALMRPYHVGDSGALVFGQRGKRKLQTIFHSPVGYALEAGLLNEREAIHHRDRHLISNALGDPRMRVEIGSSFELSPRDTLLLASDGLFDNLRTEEIIKALRKGPLDKSVARALETCASRMNGGAPTVPSKPDDLTLIAFRRM